MEDKELDVKQIREILNHLISVYAKLMEGWAEEEPLVAAAHGLAAFDLLNLVHLLDGDYEQVERNIAGAGDVGSLSLERVDVGDLAAHQGHLAAYQDERPPINAPGDDPEDPDPHTWN